MLEIDERLRIPLREFSFSFSRSSGPGGQNVNKRGTRATLHWNVARSPSLSDAVRGRLMQRQHRRINREGELQLHSQRFRDQGRNVADCLEKLRAMLREVVSEPTPRRASHPTRAGRERRLRAKRERAARKSLRRRPAETD